MCIVRERRPAGFLDMKCQTCSGIEDLRVDMVFLGCLGVHTAVRCAWPLESTMKTFLFSFFSPRHCAP